MAELPRIISVDDHIVEPKDLWTNRLPPRYDLINDTFADLREGRNIRGVIEFQSSLRSEP
jgi:hypothetical protein